MENNRDLEVSQELKFGEILFRAGVITQAQLNHALRLQKQRGGRIGEVLLELGFVSSTSLVSALKEKYLTHAADLYEMELSPQALGLLPFKMMKQYEVLPLAVGPKCIFIAMTDPGDINALNELSFYLGQRIQPIVVPSAQIKAALSLLEETDGEMVRPIKGAELKKLRAYDATNDAFPTLSELCRQLVTEKASDLLLTAGAPCSLKKNGELVRLPYSTLTPQIMKEYAYELMSENQRQEFERTNDIDFSHTFPEAGRFRVNVFRQRNSISLSFRHIVEVIPTLASLGLPDWLGEFALHPHGLILISGPTGQGKTSSMAALVDLINSNKRANIITIEDPIEYHHRHKLSNVNQREVGVDTISFYEGLKRVFRQAPDVIVVGEIRDPDSAAIALQAANTGHLVLSTVHANNATSTIERIIDFFSSHEQPQIRTQLANSLLVVLNQRLIQVQDGKSVVLAYEKLINSHRVRAHIRDGKIHQIRSMYQQSADDYQSLDIMLGHLCREGRISREEGLKLCDSPAFFQDAIARKDR